MTPGNRLERNLLSDGVRISRLEERTGGGSAGFVPVRAYGFSTLASDPARVISIIIPGRVYRFPVVPLLAELVWTEGGTRQGPGRVSLSGWDVTVVGDAIDDATTEVIADLTFNAASPGVLATPDLDADEDERPRPRPSWRAEMWAEEEAS